MDDQSKLKGKLHELKENLDRYQEDNNYFIMINGGISRFRTLRCFLIPSNYSNVSIYDIIVPKAIKQTALIIKQEEVRDLKASLGALSDVEKEDMQRDMEIDEKFSNNPFFYGQVEDLIYDLNFKNYLDAKFNIVLLNGDVMIEHFAELNDNNEEVFIASANCPEDKLKIGKAIEKILNYKNNPAIFYTTYRNTLEKNDVTLHLENFAETNEFMEGLNPLLRNIGQICPINTKKKSQEMSTLIDTKKNKRIIFKKSLNKRPIRKIEENNARVTTILPLLPQRYIIDKQKFKVPSLRYVFLKLSVVIL